MLGYNFIVFLICSLISRGLRFISLTFFNKQVWREKYKVSREAFFKTYYWY